MSGQVAQSLTGIFITGAGSDRNAQYLVFATMTGTVGTAAVLTALGRMEAFETVIDQGVQVFIGNQIDIAAIATVSAIRTTVGNIQLPAKTDTTVTTVTGIDSNLDFINKLHR